MKRIDLIKLIEEFGSVLIRHGAKHDCIAIQAQAFHSLSRARPPTPEIGDRQDASSYGVESRFIHTTGKDRADRLPTRAGLRSARWYSLFPLIKAVTATR